MDIRLSAAMALRPDLFKALKAADVEYYRRGFRKDNDTPWQEAVNKINATFSLFQDWEDVLIKLWEKESRAEAERLELLEDENGEKDL